MIKSIFILWQKAIIRLLPLSLIAALFSSLPMYAKQWATPDHNIVLYVGLIILGNLLYLIPATSIFSRLQHILHDQDITTSQAIGVGLTKFFPVLLLSLMILGIMGFFALIAAYFAFNLHIYIIAIFIIIAALMIVPYFICAMPLVILDNIAPVNALKKSIELVRHQWGYVTTIMFVVSLITSTVNFGAELLGVVPNVIMLAITLPMTFSMTILITEDLKKKQGMVN